jgi:hypothetical protein
MQRVVGGILVLVLGLSALVAIHLGIRTHGRTTRSIRALPPRASGHRAGADRGPIRCTLEPWPDGNGEHPDLRLSLTNTSEEPVTLWYYTWPHAHVTFILRDDDDAGKAVYSFHWGSLSSLAVGVDPKTGRPTTRLPTRTLKTGETYTAGIYLSTLRDYRDVFSGLYRIEAVFVYSDLGGWPAPNQDFVARSGTVGIAVTSWDRNNGREKNNWRIVR